MAPLVLSTIEVVLGLVAAGLIGGIIGYLYRRWTEQRRLGRSGARPAPRPAPDAGSTSLSWSQRMPGQPSAHLGAGGRRGAVVADTQADSAPSAQEKWRGSQLAGPADQPSGGAPGGKATVLLVDDRMELCAVHSAYLRQNGYSVLTAGDGETALELVRQHHPGVIVLDHSLPRRTGIEVTRDIRSDPATAAIPVILLTAHSYGAIGMAAQQAGVSLFLPKPADPSRVLREVERQLEECHPRS